MRWFTAKSPGLVVPDALAEACAEIPEFPSLMRLVRLARWWNVWIGGGVAVIASMGIFIAFLISPAEDPGNKRFVLLAVSAFLVGAGVTAAGIGRTLSAVLHHRPAKLRTRLLLGAICSAIFIAPLFVYLAAIVLDQAGKLTGGGGFAWWHLLIVLSVHASPVLGVFANGYPWLRLGRAYDTAAAGVAPEGA